MGKVLVIDHSKAQRVFGSVPATGLEEGLRRKVGWAKERDPSVTPTFTEIGVKKNLPPF